MILSGGSLVLKQTDIVKWRGNTAQFDGRAIELLGGWQSYSQLFRKQPWVKAPVSKIAVSTARLPLKVYERGDDTRQDARNTPYGELIRKPSPKVDSFTFWEWVTSVLEIYGESFAGKVRDAGGRPKFLVRLHPVFLHYEEDSGRWWYDDGTRKLDDIPRRDLVHFRHFNPDGERGMSQLEPLRSTLENEEGARRANSALWRNGGRPSVMLEHPGRLSEIASNRLAMQWKEIHGGVDNWAKAAVLEEGMKANIMPLNVEELQYIEARKLNREECCAVFDIPPPALQILDHATYSNITEQNRALYRDTMAPRLGRLESILDLELRDGSMGDGEPDFPEELYAEFLMDEVLRGAFEARAMAYQQSDFMTIAEKRQKENLPFIPGTEQIFLNSASLPLGPDGQLQQPDSTIDKEMSPLELSNALQKIYLSVGSVISGDEAREILNRAGAGLTGAAPEPSAAPAGFGPKGLAPASLRTLMGRMSRVTDIADIHPAQFVSGLTEGTSQVLKLLADSVDAGQSVDAFKQGLRTLALPEADSAPPVVVNVNPEKEIPATVVENHIEPTVVNVAPAEVTLPPMQVVVNMPTLVSTRREIERDANGRAIAIIDIPTYE